MKYDDRPLTTIQKVTIFLIAAIAGAIAGSCIGCAKIVPTDPEVVAAPVDRFARCEEMHSRFSHEAASACAAIETGRMLEMQHREAMAKQDEQTAMLRRLLEGPAR
jgi:predicted cobalt transporter CbtA